MTNLALTPVVPGSLTLSTFGGPIYGPAFVVSATDNQFIDTVFGAALTEASAAGGGTVILPLGHNLQLSALHDVPDGVNVTGAGNGLSASDEPATRLVCTAAGAGLRFGTQASGQRGGISGNFAIDGATIATQPFRVGRSTQRTFMNIDVYQAAADGVLVQGAQNCVFLGVNADSCGNNGIVLDLGAGGNAFLRCESNANGNYNLACTQSGTSSSGLYAVPTNNGFYQCILERRSGSTVGMILHEAGDENLFVGCTIADASPTAATTMVTCSLLSPYNSSANIRFTACRFSGNTTYTTVFNVANGTQLKVLSGTTITGALNGFSIVSGAYVQSDMAPLDFSSVTNKYTGTGSQDAFIRLRSASPIEVTRAATANQLFVGLISGDAGQRFGIFGDGTMKWGDGTGFTLDTVLQRLGANILGTASGDKLVANGGLGVGNSASATTPGTVVKKMEVFDASGASLGFVPVYDAIT